MDYADELMDYDSSLAVWDNRDFVDCWLELSKYDFYVIDNLLGEPRLLSAKEAADAHLGGMVWHDHKYTKTIKGKVYKAIRKR